jgi:crotonobetainyl-CoA:carnitine CoA-transferase CaiB-like acyl-CoA transferase
MLGDYRVLDLCDDRGHFAGFLLAHLGAEVIGVEPPGGHRTRHRPPFDAAGRALGHLAYGRGKSSLVAASPAEVAELAATADVVIDSGVLPFAVDLGALRAADPALVTVAISPFGSDGPKAGWAATDLTIAASSGALSLTGDADRRPVRIGEPQAWLQAGADAACGALLALAERRRSGLGQHVDVAAQQSMLVTTQFQMMAALVGAASPSRLPGGVKLGQFTIQFVYECADGYVTATFLFGMMIGPFTRRLFEWIHEEGFADESLRDKNWIDFALHVFEGKEPAEELDRATAVLAAFLRTKSKAELLAAALERNLLLAPVTTTRDVLSLEQLDARDFWEMVEGARHPGRFARFSATPLPPRAPAPALGAGPPGRVAAPRRDRPPSVATGSAEGSRPLEGVKVLDFMWALAGPGTTRMMADYGATVVKVETQKRADVLRSVNPFIGGEGGQENALQFHSLNAGKLGLALDVGTPQGREVILDLVRWADVVTESFSPKAMAAWGLGYDALAAVNPGLVMFSSCLMGQTGPLRMYAGFGTMAAALAGFYPVTGWPDRAPAGPFTAYTDYVSPRFSLLAILAALEHRRRTGEGQHIDFSQLEGALHLLTPALLDDQLNGVVATRNSNTDRFAVPHDVYPALGEDRWIAIATETDEQWAALAEVLGRPDLAGLSAAERRDRLDEVDAVISGWTAVSDAVAAQDRLQAAGVPAHLVAVSADCVADPQLRHRQQFVPAPHPLHGTSWVEGSPFRLSRTPAQVAWAGPTFGQHLEEVLGGILGYDGDRIADLIIAGVLE